MIRSKVNNKEFNDNWERIFGKDKFKRPDRSSFEYPPIDNTRNSDLLNNGHDFPFNNDIGN